MDILGVGPAEMILIGLVIVLVAGPERSAIWARKTGLYIRQFGQYVNAVLKDFETELGDDGRELMSAAQELRESAREIRTATNPRQTVSKISKMVEDMPVSDTNRKTLREELTIKPFEGWNKPKDEESGQQAAKPVSDKPYEGWNAPASDDEESDEA